LTSRLAKPRYAVTLRLVNGLALFNTYGLFSFMFGPGLGFLMRSAARQGLTFGRRNRDRMIELLIFCIARGCLLPLRSGSECCANLERPLRGMPPCSIFAPPTAAQGRTCRSRPSLTCEVLHRSGGQYAHFPVIRGFSLDDWEVGKADLKKSSRMNQSEPHQKFENPARASAPSSRKRGVRARKSVVPFKVGRPAKFRIGVSSRQFESALAPNKCWGRAWGSHERPRQIPM
jgi:hypothetical protein